MLYYKKNFKYYRVKGSLLMIIAGVVTFLLYMKSTKPTKVVSVKERVVVHDSDVFTPERLYNYIVECGIKFPDIVYRQALLESGRFSSDIFVCGNNLFGMKVAKQRPTTATGEYKGHAEYRDWRASVQDYALFQSAFMRKYKTEEQYYKALGKSYAEDDSYIRLLKNMSDTLLNKNK